MRIRIAIAGYGNLGRGVECAIKQNPDTELYGIFTRRAPADVKTLTDVAVYSMDDIVAHKVIYIKKGRFSYRPLNFLTYA